MSADANPTQLTLADVLAAIRIDSPHGFTLGGKSFGVPPAPPMPPGPVPGAREAAEPPLVGYLSGALYRYVYSRPFRPPLPEADPPALSPEDEGLAAELSIANAGRDRWEEGWTITEVHSGGQVTAQRGGTVRSLWPGQFLSKDGPGARPRVGARISLFYPKESSSLQPGFYYSFGETPEDDGAALGLVRAYWNVRLEGAPRLVELLTERLNRFQVPFRLKCAVLPGEYARSDVAVLYLAKRSFPIFADLLCDVYPELRPHLDEEVPLFALRLAPGVGIAEDPGNGESFGQHRCRVLAESCWSAFLRGGLPPEELLAETRKRLAEAGADPDYLYLNAGSLDVYAAPPGLNGSGAIPAARPAIAPPAPEGDRGRFLEVAFSLGTRICRDALWAGERCNWIGFSMESLGGRWRQVHRAYGPELYGGTSGIGLFLARLHAATGERAFRRTALGALRHALARAEEVEPPTRPGFYSGWTGIAQAALEGAALLGLAEDDSLREPALALLAQVAGGEVASAPGEGVDVLAGAAGAIPSLLFVQRALGGPASLLDGAVRLGDHLLATAVRSGDGWSWGDYGQPGSRLRGNLTGFSHGAGGMGWALLELWRATGEERFREAGEAAFRYERQHFDPERGNWPDLRDPELSGGPKDGPAFMAAWCHGAPGLALSRLRAWEILGDDVYRAEAETALATTYANVLGVTELSQTNYSLCHGLGGNGDVLLFGAERLGNLGNPDWRSRAEEIGLRGLAAHHAQKRPWPCGTYGSVEVPGLMVGLAGIGWFYLRLALPETPTVLIVVPP